MVHFIQGPTYNHHFLQQISTRILEYIEPLQKVPKKYKKEPNQSITSIHGPTIVTMTTTLPPFVLPYYWKFCHLSFNDLLKQAENLPAKLYWISCLLHGIDVSPLVMKPSSSLCDVIIPSKKIPIQKIVRSQEMILSDIDRCIHHSKHHVPCLPKIIVSREVMSHLSSLIYPNLHLNENNNDQHVPGIFTFNNLLFLPVSFLEDGILLKRVVPFLQYCQSGKLIPDCYASTPLTFTCTINKHDEKFAVTEDAIFFTSS